MEKDKGVSAALKLLERTPDQEYINEWTEILARPKNPVEERGHTVVVFRLGKEWLAIDSTVFVEVIADRPAHRIPHRTNEVLKGLVNYRGSMTLCIDMHRFLGIESESGRHDESRAHPKFKRMAVVQKEMEQWVFSVDDVQGVINFKEQIGNTPVTLSKSTANLLKGVISWNDVDLGYIDDELLFFGLKRNLL